MQPNVYTVSQVNRYIKRLMENDVFLNDVFLEAEISNFKFHNSGHWYFTLKDENSSLNGVMFRSDTRSVKFLPENGMRVLIYGRISVYEKSGQYQLYANFMEPAGKGALYMAFEQLKEKLSKEGLFAQEHKRPISRFPKCLAVITSPTGAAIRDILQITKRRDPSVKIVILPVLVQGEDAAEDIAKALEKVNKWGKADTVIVGRGGGSMEDLWAFNEEIVARAIYNSRIPVISAVGHETDFTISDFVADMRAPTPSAAAELAVPSVEQLSEGYKTAFKRIEYLFNTKYMTAKQSLAKIKESRVFAEPLEKIYNNSIYTEQLTERMNKSMDTLLSGKKVILGKTISALENISPVNVLKRGYSLVYKDDKLISRYEELKKSDRIDIKFSSGSVRAVVENVEE